VIVCRKCSRRVADGTEFCVCGAYLEFDGEHVPDDGGPAAAAAPTTGVAASPSAPLPPPPAARQQPTAGEWATQPGASTGRQAPVPTEPAPWSGFGSTPAEPAPATAGIDAVHPDAPERAATTQPVWVEAGARDGDVACRQCGTPNGPERFFCRHCGMSLTGAVDGAATTATKAPSWWKRLVGGAKARAGAMDATTALNRVHGLSRGGMSGRTMLFRSGGIVVLLGGLLAFLGPWRGPVLAKAREAIGADRHSAIEIAPEEVASIVADPAITPVEFELQGPENVVDRFANTAWATRWLDPVGPGFETVPTDTECQPAAMTDTRLVFEFEDPRDIARLQILPGRPDLDESRTLFLRPRVLELRADDGACTYVELADSGELATVDFDHDDVATLTVGIVGVYESDAPSETVEISEIVVEK
jgi:hypothetical protein